MPVEPDIPPHEERILGELERLQLAIQATREQRERAKAELATHLSAFDPPVVRARPTVAPPPPASVPASPPAAIAAAVDPPPPIRGDPQPAAPIPPQALAFEPLPSLSRSPRELFGDEPREWGEAPRKWGRLPLVAAAVALAAIVLVVWLARRGSDGTGAPAVVSSPRQEAQAPAPVAAPPPQPATPAHAVDVAIETLRPVWLRVTVDGTTAVEQELPAGTTRTFGGDTSVVLRVGDAGALRLSIGGVDQGVLGKDGQVVTRRILK